MERLQNASAIFGVLTCLTLAGCASKATSPADFMRADSVGDQARVELRERLAKQWEKGDKLIAKGEKSIEKGNDRITSAQKDMKAAERDIEKGKSEVQHGEEQVAKGKRMKDEARSRFQAEFPDVALQPAP